MCALFIFLRTIFLSLYKPFRNLKKDKDITKSVITADPSFIDKIPRQYVGHISPFILAQGKGIKSKKYVAELKGVVCITGKTTSVDTKQVPACTYCHPQVASIGVTEKMAKEQGLEIKVGKFPFSASGKASAIGDTSGFVKKIFDAKYNQLIGVHMVGPEVTELLTASSIALSHGATAESIIQTIHAHPTLGESMMEAAAAALDEAIHM